MTPPLVSVIIPCRNEARYIEGCLDSLLSSDYPSERLEILVVDGMSDDGTPSRLARYAAREPRIRVFDNPKRIVPAAMNIGLTQARGDVIVRVDAHSEYPRHYVSALVGWLERTGADNVGGAWRTLPADGSAIARAIALALSHPFGIGNAQFRLGVSQPTPVDTVPFGCFRRTLFERIGPFDEELVRNQDDELNFRILRQGGRILLVPDVVSTYYARGSLRQLARMYYQYGLFKPLVAYKVGRVMTARQLAPLLLVLGLLAGIIGAPWSQAARLGLGALLVVYLGVALSVGLWSARRESLRLGTPLAVAFTTLHLSYGLGFLVGVLRLFLRRWWSSPEPTSVPLSR